MLYQYFVGVGLLEKQILNFGGETMFGGRGQWKIINMLQVFFCFPLPSPGVRARAIPGMAPAGTTRGSTGSWPGGAPPATGRSLNFEFSPRLAP